MSWMKISEWLAIDLSLSRTLSVECREHPKHASIHQIHRMLGSNHQVRSIFLIPNTHFFKLPPSTSIWSLMVQPCKVCHLLLLKVLLLLDSGSDTILWAMELLGNLLFVGGSFLVPVWLMTHHSSRSSLVGTSIQRIIFMSAHLIISYVWMAKVSEPRTRVRLD